MIMWHFLHYVIFLHSINLTLGGLSVVDHKHWFWNLRFFLEHKRLTFLKNCYFWTIHEMWSWMLPYYYRRLDANAERPLNLSTKMDDQQGSEPQAPESQAYGGPLSYGYGGWEHFYHNFLSVSAYCFHHHCCLLRDLLCIFFVSLDICVLSC